MMAGCTNKNDKNEIDLEMYGKVQVTSAFGMHGSLYLNHAANEIYRGNAKYDRLFLFPDQETADSAVESGEIGENDIYAVATEATTKRLDYLNWAINRDENTDCVAEFGLSYPITLEQLLDHPEMIWQLINDRDVISYTEYWMICNY